MELRHLRYFVAVAEQRHFGRAAARLHMAQPPLSHQIRQLEAELGVELLRRTTRRVDLTEAGATYLQRAREVLAAVDAASLEAQRIGAGLEGRLIVGCVGSATYSLLPSFVRMLQEKLPAVDLSFHGEILVPDLVAALVAGEIDLALLRPPVDQPGISLTPLRRERLLIAVPDRHSLAGRKSIRMADLRNEDFILHAGHGRSVMNSLVLDLCRDAGFEPRVRQEVGETSTLITFVASGLGVAVVPEPASALGVEAVAYVPLTGGGHVDLSAATRADDESPALARALQLVVTLTQG